MVQETVGSKDCELEMLMAMVSTYRLVQEPVGSKDWELEILIAVVSAYLFGAGDGGFEGLGVGDVDG